jgi:LysR family transcriptional regulator, regulator for bpeEF and oprC
MDKLRALKFFCVAVEAKSFAAAAHDLGVVPSVLSKTIAALEADIHFRLFNRSTRTLSITESGARYYEHCKRLITELEEVEAISHDGVAKPAGRLRVGMHPAVLIVFMRQIDTFMQSHPEIVVETTIRGTPATLVEENLDVLVTVGDLADSSLTARKLGVTHHVLVASPSYLAAQGTPEVPRDLASHRVIVSGRRDGPAFTQWTMTRARETESVFIPARAISREGILMHEACLAGGGICRLAEFSVRGRLQRGELVAVLSDWSLGELPIHAVFPGRKDIPAKVSAFVRFVEMALLHELAAK